MQQLIKPRTKIKRFELGIFATAFAFKIPNNYEFDKKEVSKNQTVNGSNQAFATNIQLAYAIAPNLWINTGFRKANIQVSQKFSTTLYYDKSSEYTDDEGKTYNSLSFNEKESGSDVANELNFEIPTATDIEDKELYFAEWNRNLDFSWTQIPLGLSYFRGNKSLQWFAKGGIAWNKISGYEYFEEANLLYKGQNLPIKETGFTNKKEALDSQFISSYAGLGLNYQLTQNWQARTSFTLEQNFTQSKQAVNLGKINQVLDLGFAYRF